MTAKDELFQKAKQIKKEIGEKTVEEAKEQKIAESQLAAIQQNPELARMYQESAEVGSKNLSGQLPLLKVHSVGKSSKNELSDGTEPTDGYFFYKPTKEQFQTIDCHILTISQGFYAKGLQGDKEVFNQILAGVIINDGDWKPFIMYFTGLKLSRMWEFGKEASPYTKARPVPIPMFTMKVRLTTEKVDTSFGKSWVINFELLRDERGYPQTVLDTVTFKALREAVTTVENTIANLIESKTPIEAVEERPEDLLKGTAAEVDDNEPSKEPVDSEDIPF